MNRTKKIFIIIFFMLVIVGSIVCISMNKNEKEVEEAAVNTVFKDEQLLMNGLEKAPSADNIIFLCESEDCSFKVGDESLVKAAKYILGDMYDGIVLKTDKLSSEKNKKVDSAEINKLKTLCDYFSKKDKKVYIYTTASVEASSLSALSVLCDGLVIDIRTVVTEKAQELSEKLDAIKLKVKDKKIILYSGRDNLVLYSLDKNCFDGIFSVLEGQADADRFKKLYADFSPLGKDIYPITDYSLYGDGGLNADKPLRALYEIKDCTEITGRVFLSYSSVRSNKDNCYGAVRTYITSGIAPDIAFRGPFVLDSSDKIREVTEPAAKVRVFASNLFPVYAGKRNLGIFSKGSKEVNLELVRGKNTVSFSQNGMAADYQVNYIFEGDIIKSVSPSDTLRVSPGEQLTVMIVAYSEAKVFVKLGATQYEAKKQEDMKGFTAFFAKIQIPSDMETINSMGRMKITATLGEQSQTVDGAEIIPIMLENVPVVSASVQSTQGVTYEIGNYNPTYIDVEQQVLPSISDAISRATTNSFDTPYTGNQMAVITAEYADVKPANSDDDYVPYYTYLAKGTTDFVVGESKSVDSDEGTTHHYYDLACGLKVSSDSAILQAATTVPENVFTVNSVYGNSGELVIRLKSTWKVPYFMNLENQYYYSGHSKSYNVSEFTASAVSLTFHYTTGAYGEIDCSASDVVSSASWSVSPADKTATLYMPLKQPGAYYGYSLSYEGDETVITVNAKPKGIAGSVVVLDPGHGADDPGALGLSGAVKESDINILVAYQVKTALEQQGVKVYMTRYGDDDINLEGRKIFARSVKPDLFVSIHSNASENSSSIGVSSYYYKPFSMSLASDIYEELLSVYRESFYAGQQELYDTISKGVIYYPFSVTRLEECPSTLVEIGFMTNDAECYMLTREENQRLMGQAIARGICRSLTR